MSCLTRVLSKDISKGCLGIGSKDWLYYVPLDDIDSWTPLDATNAPGVFTGVTLKAGGKRAFYVKGQNNSHNLTDGFERGTLIGANTQAVNFWALSVDPLTKNEIDIMARDQIQLVAFFFDGKGRCHVAGKEEGLTLQSYTSDTTNTDYGNAYNIVLDNPNADGITKSFGDYTLDGTDLVESTYAGTKALLDALLTPTAA